MSQTETVDQHLEVHGRMIREIENLTDYVDKFTEQKARKEALQVLGHLSDLRMDAEFLAMGRDWAEYFMRENEWSEKDIQETIIRLFGNAKPTARQPLQLVGS